MKIVIGTDHRGWRLKNHVKNYLKQLGHDTIILEAAATRHGAVETPQEGEVYAKFLKDNVGKTPSQYKSFWKKLVFTGKGSLVEVQGTAEGADFSRAELDSMLDTGWIGAQQVMAKQREVIAPRLEALGLEMP